MKPEEWDTVIHTNLSGMFHCARAAARAMLRQRWGRIIAITSVVGLTGNAGQTNYAASKAGLIGFTKALAKELGPRGITVNAVAPGFIETDMTRALSDTQRQALLQHIPLFWHARRCGRPVLFWPDEARHHRRGGERGGGIDHLKEETTDHNY
jgi:3-oxoacyl-[acyl-carrier protein] reductase